MAKIDIKTYVISRLTALKKEYRNDTMGGGSGKGATLKFEEVLAMAANFGIKTKGVDVIDAP